MKKIATLAAALGFTAIAATGASAATCASLDATASYPTFGSCTGTGNDDFATVNAIVVALFSDEGISISQSGSFSPGPGTGSEFFGDRLGDGFDIEPSSVGGSDTFEFVSLPTGTIFVSLKQGSSFELFGVPGVGGIPGGLPFTLTHSLGGGSTSHISTFAGEAPPPGPGPVPLPAAAWLMLSGAGALGALRLKRKG